LAEPPQSFLTPEHDSGWFAQLITKEKAIFNHLSARDQLHRSPAAHNPEWGKVYIR
jgi:hypothetical protein